MKIHTKDFRAPGGKKINLKQWPTKVAPYYRSKKEFEHILQSHREDLQIQQDLLYSNSKHSLLLIFQAMDAAGKDSAIKHVMSGVNPQGCQVFSFKHPSVEELKHDFLWRTTRDFPEKGRIGIFNRSHYEEVLIARVHPEILEAEGFDQKCAKEKDFWKERYRSIVHLENHLSRNFTIVLKFFLHISSDEQRKRFLERIDNPRKNWKFSASDMIEREYWDEYMSAYENCIEATSTRDAPWFIVPSDDKANAQIIISHILLKTFKDLKMTYPKISPAQQKELKKMRAQLLKK